MTCSSPFGPSSPSMVRICLPSASGASSRQLLIGLPSTRTVQAPHIPMPQPSRAPNSLSSSRSTWSKVWWGGALTRGRRPLTSRVRLSLPSSSVGRGCGSSSVVWVIDSPQLAQAAQHLLGGDRQVRDPHTGRAADGVADRGHDRRDGGLADAVDLVRLEVFEQ